MKYLLDTNICIYFAKHKPASVRKIFSETPLGDMGISVVTYGELLFGCQKSNRPYKSLDILERIVTLIPVNTLPHGAAYYYAKTRAALEKEGKIIGKNDLWIAAHALAEDVTLVTNNTREFSRVEGLKIEDWVVSEEPAFS